MASRAAGVSLQHAWKLIDAEAVRQLSDGQLLERFAAHRDESAFAALLQRHAKLVYGVCRNVLRQEQDAEDVFQAAFLVLARRAASIRAEKSLGNWLYRVAYRLALRARKSAARRRQQEAQAPPPAPQEDSAAADLGWRELQGMLDEELHRLPEKYRAPFVLCCLVNKSKAEAAGELGWKEGTVSSRLAHARKLLQERLSRRGVTLSAVLCGLAVAQNAAAGAVPTALLAATYPAALAFAAGETLGANPQSVALARTVLRTAVLSRLAWATALLALLGLLAGGAALAFRQPETDEPPQPPPVLAAGPAPKAGQEKGDGAADRPGPRLMTVGGQVLGADGRPIANARVAVVAAEKRRPGDTSRFGPLNMRLLGEGRADGRGQYRLDVPQTTAMNHNLTALAWAPDHALSSGTVDPGTVTASAHTIGLRLAPAMSARGRLVDLQGGGAAGVRVHVLGLSRQGPQGVYLLNCEPPVTLPGWPESVTTDAAGNFTLHGVGPETEAMLQVRDERYATQWLKMERGKGESAAAAVLPLLPPRVLEGRLSAADGAPLAGVTVVVETVPGQGASLRGLVETRTDALGRYRLRPFPADRYHVSAYPPADAPFLSVQQQLKWPAGAAQQKVDVTLPPALLVRGTVREEGSGKPVAGASVSHEWLRQNNPHYERVRAMPGVQWETCDAVSGADGAFALAVPPGPGNLLVKAAEPDYVHVELRSGRLINGNRGGLARFPDAVLPLRPEPGDAPKEVTVTLRRGATLRGRVLGGDGKPAAPVLLARHYVPVGLEVKGVPIETRGGRFEVPGCEPGGKVPLWFYDAARGEGAHVELPAEGAAEVRLAPCVAAKMRFVDRAGKPLPQTRVMVDLVFRPGDNTNVSLVKGTTPRLTMRAATLYGMYYPPPVSPDGRLTLPRLIPGATYIVLVEARLGWPERTTFTAPLTGVLDLGDLVMEPQRIPGIKPGE